MFLDGKPWGVISLSKKWVCRFTINPFSFLFYQSRINFAKDMSLLKPEFIGRCAHLLCKSWQRLVIT